MDCKISIIFIKVIAAIVFTQQNNYVEGCQSRMTRPRLKFSPSIDDSTLIWYKNDKPSTYENYIKEIDRFLAKYRLRDKSSSVEDCQFGQRPSSSNKVCDFKIIRNHFTPCVPEESYGFDFFSGGPCVFLYLEEILDWKPELYNSSTLHQNMSEFLKSRISQNEDSGQHHLIWVSCEGGTPTDKENLGPILYLPQVGFDEKYFPYKKIDGYLNPIVAVYFEKPSRGIVINVNCKAWARNLNHQENEGIVNFDILID